MRQRKYLWTSAVLLTLLVSLVIVGNSAWLVPEWPVTTVFIKSLWLLVVCGLLFFLVFKVLDYYYLQLDRQLTSLATLHQAMINLNANLNLAHRCSESLSMVMELTQGSKGLFFILDDKLKKFAQAEYFSVQKSQPRRLISSRYRYHIFTPARISPEDQKLVDELVKTHSFSSFPSVVLVPFYNEKKTLALAIVGSNEDSRRFLRELTELMSILVAQVVTSFENSLLHEEVNEASITDPLTSLYNRRYFRLRLQSTFAEARRIGFPVSVMISDLDNFKYYVDTFGHPRGDRILAQAASLIRESVRTSDIVCRFGGDEFAYILPYSSSLEALSVAERIRKAVASCTFQSSPQDEPVHLTLSLGIASFPEHGETEEQLLKSADMALFWAKSQGKDKVIVYNQPTEVSYERK
ncbi:MAG: GGDEF domain-containing protein [Candidatus Omnitrophica bacterium]|nr:GGDEF domain-containing protein [Candidatus Omnitrophota bacterium]